MASYLAGEKWSDHPRCTHPLLAELARDVNDVVCDETRQRLAPMIPDVVGLNPVDPRVDVEVARLCTLAALPISPYAAQRVAAVGLLRCERMLAALERRPPDQLSAAARDGLASAPEAAAWARRLAGEIGIPEGRAADRTFARETGTVIVQHCVRGISRACVQDPEAVLVDLLRRAIELCRVAEPAERYAAAATYRQRPSSPARRARSRQ